MRGALAHDLDTNLSQRIIPAYAGSTYATEGARSSGKDHPRVCGEHT